MHPEDEVQFNRRAITDDFLAEIDALAAPVEDQAAAPAATPANPIKPALMQLISATAADLKQDAYAHGWTAQGWREIDAHRAANKEEYNRKRRDERRDEIFERTGVLPRRNRKNPTPEQRAADLAINSKNYRKRMTPEQKKAEAIRKKESREKAKKAEQAELQRHPKFGII